MTSLSKISFPYSHPPLFFTIPNDKSSDKTRKGALVKGTFTFLYNSLFTSRIFDRGIERYPLIPLRYEAIDCILPYDRNGSKNPF